jgi:rhamnopyranosyl-N-acetylglucosaminyl-diphospho-decaprenol beta-1,3/1,4-galactofuranosyltransferase
MATGKRSGEAPRVEDRKVRLLACLPSDLTEGVEQSGRIAAIVPTWNRRTSLRQCLEALLAQTRPLDEILVVDNGSADGTAEMVCREYKGRVKLLSNAENIGCTGAYCQGLRTCLEAGCAWFWLIDDDCVPEPDALERLHGEAIVNPCAIYGPKMVDARSGKPLWYRWPVTPPDIWAVQSIPFGGMFLSRQIVGAVGLPLCSLWICADDVEYSLRARERGYPSFIVPKSIVFHPEPASFRWGRIGSRSLLVYPKYCSPDRAYYHVRNWTFILLRYWRQLSALALISQFRNIVCLVFSGAIPPRLTFKAVVDALGFYSSSK